MEGKFIELNPNSNSEISREVLINNDMFDEVVVKSSWDSHGKAIADGKKVFKNAKVLLEKVTRSLNIPSKAPTTYYILEAHINGEKISDLIMSCKGSNSGNKKRLTIKACSGQG